MVKGSPGNERPLPAWPNSSYACPGGIQLLLYPRCVAHRFGGGEFRSGESKERFGVHSQFSRYRRHHTPRLLLAGYEVHDRIRGDGELESLLVYACRCTLSAPFRGSGVPGAPLSVYREEHSDSTEE